jgi:hypothetical protein
MRRDDIPEAFRSFQTGGWKNVFLLSKAVDNLYGTEDIFGDWSGETLLLARDGCPASAILACSDRDVVNPWRSATEGGGSKTNQWLIAHAHDIPKGKLYGSACAHLLVDDAGSPGSYSTKFRNFGDVEGHLVEVLRWVIGEMPNLRRIVCLGSTAWHIANLALGNDEVARAFRKYRDNSTISTGKVGNRTIQAFAVWHPAARINKERKEGTWNAMIRQIRADLAS